MKDKLMDMVHVTPSKQALKMVKPIWHEENGMEVEVEYFDCVDIRMPKHEWARVQFIVELYEMSNKHPAMRDLAMQYHMMYELLKEQL